MGSPIRQEILEIALDWISNGKIEEYMSVHQQDPNANELMGTVDFQKAKGERRMSAKKVFTADAVSILR